VETYYVLDEIKKKHTNFFSYHEIAYGLKKNVDFSKPELLFSYPPMVSDLPLKLVFKTPD
jgi:hypothetical protein